MSFENWQKENTGFDAWQKKNAAKFEVERKLGPEFSPLWIA